MAIRSRKRSKAGVLVSALLIVACAATGGVVALAEDESVETEKKFIAKAEKLYYYEKDRKKRYVKYHNEHPKYSASTVVWRVDADLDKDFYDKPVTTVEEYSETVLVNKQHKLPKGFEPEKLSKVDSARMTPAAAKAVRAMKKAAEEDGVYIYARTSGYRSFVTQKSLNNNIGKKQSTPDNSRARAGFSEHQTGLAVDMSNSNGSYLSITYNCKEGKWLRKNSWKYGFIVRYTPQNKSITGYISEPWHVRYIGRDHAEAMHESGYKSYEEYWVKHIAHTKPGDEPEPAVPQDPEQAPAPKPAQPAEPDPSPTPDLSTPPALEIATSSTPE
jgi:D-alanyl-D-alanine carboxypeptidase